MIKEDYVSYEIAKLLKEKGFNQECFAKYANEFCTEEYYDDYRERMMSWEIKPGKLIIPRIDRDKYDICGDTISAPTLQLTLRWLREVHDIFIQPCIVNGATITMDQRYYFYNIFKNRGKISCSETYYNIPEEALEAAIKYCLENLI